MGKSKFCFCCLRGGERLTRVFSVDSPTNYADGLRKLFSHAELFGMSSLSVRSLMVLMRLDLNRRTYPSAERPFSSCLWPTLGPRTETNRTSHGQLERVLCDCCPYVCRARPWPTHG